MAKDRAEQIEQYGYVEGLFDAVPELRRLFDRTLKGDWSPAKFQAELRETRWWKKHAQSEKDYLVLLYGDPATARQKMGQALTEVKQAAAQMGVKITGEMSKVFSGAAYNVVAKGWTSDDLKYYLGRFVHFDNSKLPGGEAGQAIDQLQQYSYAMGIKNSNKWYLDRAREIVRGSSTVQDAQSAIRKQAQGMFPGWQKQLEMGQTVADLASPYMQSMAQLLEIPPGSINLFDPSIKKALQFKDPKTGKTSAQPLWAFENKIREDPRWAKTKNAQDSTMQNAHQVLSDFGLVF